MAQAFEKTMDTSSARAREIELIQTRLAVLSVLESTLETNCACTAFARLSCSSAPASAPAAALGNQKLVELLTGLQLFPYPQRLLTPA